MSDAHHVPTAPAQLFWRQRGMLLLALVVVLLPVALSYFLATQTGSEAVALLGTPLCLLLAWSNLRMRGVRWADLGMRFDISLLRIVAITLPAVVLLVVATGLLAAALQSLTGLAPDISRFDPLRGNVPLLLGGLALVWTTAAFGEELVFRGYVMHTLRDIRSPQTTTFSSWLLPLLLSSVLFGLAHAYQGAAGIILTGIIGLGYGLVFFASKTNLWPAILTHGLYDTVGFVVVFLSADRSP